MANADTPTKITTAITPAKKRNGKSQSGSAEGVRTFFIDILDIIGTLNSKYRPVK